MAIRKKLAHGDQAKKVEETNPEALKDAIQSASIIEERSSGLVEFIERYKKLTGLPPLKLETFAIEELFTKIEKLFQSEFQSKGVQFLRSGHCSKELEADRQMLEQVLINLVKNSLEALSHTKDPQLELSCTQNDEGQVSFTIRDNGEGIPGEKLEQVFIPFFTTRKEGSGIGLSLCRQIIRSHKGRMYIESEPGQGTRVIIIL
jgi:signal transduction histidine kinase